jgi:branched-chain amino acid transport system ATP-binding protein
MMGRFPSCAKERAAPTPGRPAEAFEVARGLLLDPKLMLIDEPSIGLSPVLVQEVPLSSPSCAPGASPSCDRAGTPVGPADLGLRPVLEQGHAHREHGAEHLADQRIAQLFLGGGLQQETEKAR